MFLLFLAILPTIFLLVYLMKKDKVEKEPVRVVLKVFILGCLSIIPAFILEEIFAATVLTFFTEGTALFIIVENFFGVALIEEWSKRLAAKLGVWKNPAFNYKFDAIVYCVVAALGFATLENVMYVVENGFFVALTRALLSVPSHAIDGLLMGYFFGVAKEAEIRGNKRQKKIFYRLSLIIPMIDHGIYDAALSTDSGLIALGFFAFVLVVDIWAIKFIKRQSEEDAPLF